MSKIIYDVIQRFEVENGVPRLVSTNIQVIQGGEDLLSLTISLLTQMGFYEKFEEKRTSQYVGYRLKNRAKGDKRYQLVLAQRKEGLCVSVPKNILQSHILELEYYAFASFINDFCSEDYEWITIGSFWVIPSKKSIFLKTFNCPEVSLNNQTKGRFCFHYPSDSILEQEYPYHFNKTTLAEETSYLILEEDKLFPYTLQAYTDSASALREFITFFAKIIMEQQ